MIEQGCFNGKRCVVQEENIMRAIFKAAITATVAMVILGMGFISNANAQCGGARLVKSANIESQSWDGAGQFTNASFILAPPCLSDSPIRPDMISHRRRRAGPPASGGR